MKIMTVVSITLCAIAAGQAVAGAPPLQVRKSISIDAPAEKVWAAVKDFNALNSWHPAVATDEIVAGANNAPGAVRLLTLKGGGTIKEKLLEFDETAHTFKYSIVEGVLPVSHYSSMLLIRPAGADKSLVTWSGRFKRKNLADNPGATEDDKTAIDTISGVYQSGLDNLKKKLEEK
jgi:mxaD protein